MIWTDGLELEQAPRGRGQGDPPWREAARLSSLAVLRTGRRVLKASPRWVARLARRLEAQTGNRARVGRGIDQGAVTAAAVQAEAHAWIAQHAGRQEVERLLGAFSGELEKLDEVLEVLAA